MSIIATALRHMLAAGMDHDAIVAAVAEMEREVEAPVDRAAEKRREWDRERKRKQRNSVISGGSQVETARSRVDGEILSSPEGSSPTPPSPKPLQSIPTSPPKGGSSPTDRAIEVFSDQASKAGIPVPRKITADRRRKIEARLREHGEDGWAEACLRMASSAFCRGENERGWRADLDFLCQPKSFNGLIEGKYDDRPSQRSQAPPRRESEFARHQRECTEALERSVLGDRRNEYSSSDNTAFDLEPGNWRSH